MLNNFVAIDFETANGNRSSVCSVGLVLVENGLIVEKLYSLIKPTPNFYSSFTTEIHGLTARETNNSLPFPEVWNQFLSLVSDLPFVAHNSPFDASCLKAAYRAYEMDYPDFDFYCTLRAARQQLPELENHKLHTVASYCGFDLHNHHHALADAEACAAIALKLL